MTTIQRTKRGRRSQKGRRAAERDRGGPTAERARHGEFRQVRIEGPDGAPAVVWMPADLPEVLTDAMTDRHRAVAAVLQALWLAADQCPGVSRDPDAIGGGSETDGPQATVTAQRYAEACRTLRRYEARVAGVHPTAWFLLRAVLHDRRPWRDTIVGLDMAAPGYAVETIIRSLEAVVDKTP